MTYFAAPAKNEISNTPSPTNAAANAGFGKLWDMITGLFGTTGKPAEAYAAMKLLDSKHLTNLKPTFAVVANALTITLKDKDAVDLSENNPGFVAQRHATLGDGGFNLRKVAANISFVASAGSTFGHVANFLLPLYIYLIDNGGVQEFGVSRSFFGESGIVTTTAEGGAGAADSATVMYSTTARASVPFRLISIAWLNQAVAGNWVNLPTEVKQPPFVLHQVGEEVTYMGGTVSYGYLLEDGSNVSRTTYAKLFGSTGTTWGVGDGSTTFGLPDSRRRTAVGSGGTGTGTLGNAVGNVGGEEAHAQTSGELATHGHTVNCGAQGGTSNNAARGSYRETDGNITTSASWVINTGSGNAANVIQPSMVVTKMIRWLGDIC